MLYVVFILLVVVVVWFKFNYAKIKGDFGERFVANKLDRLDHIHYKILNDVLLPSGGNTPTTQIDHIVISNFGIFCIETKNYDGWIFGSTNREYWTQIIYRYKKKFRNPLWQNYGHIKAIQKLLEEIRPNLSITSYVVFPTADKLKISGTDCVGCGRDLINKILSFKQEIITDSERDKIVAVLENVNIQDKEARKQHIKNIKGLK